MPADTLLLDAGTEMEIRTGHRRLLEAFSDFSTSFTVPLHGQVDVEGMRAAVAFLRQSVLPFARWEERHLLPESHRAEDTAFEHAFLAVEIDALDTAVGALLLALDQGTDPWRTAAERVQRHAHRIEAILELHVLKEADRELPPLLAPEPCRPGSEGPAAATAPPASAGGPRRMSGAEAIAFLRSNDWGMLATVGDAQPYAVPVGYGFDGRVLYFASGPGRKLRNLETHPRASLTVGQIRDGDQWRTVVATGEALPVNGVAARIAAIRALQRQRGGTPSLDDVRRFARARLFQIVPTEITGRERG